MFCPRCKSEYREGFTHCADCDVDLVPELARSTKGHEVELVNVFECRNPALVPLIESILDGAGIEFLTRNENLQDMFGGGRMGTGFNTILGPVQFWVREDDAAAAKALLADLETAER